MFQIFGMLTARTCNGAVLKAFMRVVCTVQPQMVASLFEDGSRTALRMLVPLKPGIPLCSFNPALKFSPKSYAECDGELSPRDPSTNDLLTQKYY